MKSGFCCIEVSPFPLNAVVCRNFTVPQGKQSYVISADVPGVIPCDVVITMINFDIFEVKTW